MSSYQLQKLIYSYLREVEESPERSDVRTAGYDLTDAEREAVEKTDIRALYELGVHPVLLNSYARAMGFARQDYRKLLDGAGTQQGGTPRWLKS